MTDRNAATHDETPVHPVTELLRLLQTAMEDAGLAMSRRMRLRHTDLTAMAHLTFAPSWLGPRQLGNRLGITPAAATELVDRLERAGHVERHRDTRDRRRVNLVPTASALAEVGDQLRPLTSALDAVAAGYSKQEQELISRYLYQVLEEFQAFVAEPDR